MGIHSHYVFINISGLPDRFIWRRGVLKHRVWGFGGVFVYGHVLVYLGICICVWKCLCLEIFPCILIYIYISICLGMFAMFGCMW